MKIGVALPNFGRFASKQNITEISRAAEDLGYDSLWVSDHIVIPRSHRGFGDKFYELFSVLAYIAAITNQVRLGTSVIVAPYRNPLVTAKIISTIDVLSEGRTIIGVGPGWLEDEFNAIGANFRDRGMVTDEYIEILKVLFTEKNPEYSGKYISFKDIGFSPLPFQKPHPPIWIGGNSRRALERAVKYGNGWHAVGLIPEEVSRSRKYLMESLSEEISSDFTISLRKNLQITDKSIDNERELLRGSRDKISEGISRFKEAGVEHLVLQVLAGKFSQIMDSIDIFAQEIRRNSF